MKDFIDELVFSDDKTTFAIMTDQGIYVNTTGRELQPEEIKPHTMVCLHCGKVYENVTLLTVPHCDCGGKGYESID